MFSSQLILSGTWQQRQKTAFNIIEKTLKIDFSKIKSHPDLIVVEGGNSLSISQVRNLQRQLSLKPHSAPVKVALIPQAEKLTIPAQNALLKTLEEPPEKTLIVLLAPKRENLLPTIISRCRVTQLDQGPYSEINKEYLALHLPLFISLLKSSMSERLKLAQKFSVREEALQLTKSLLWFWRELILSKAQIIPEDKAKELTCLTLAQIKVALKNTEATRIMLEANVHPLLAIENLFLTYPSLALKT